MIDKQTKDFLKKSEIDVLPKNWQNAITRIYSAYPLKCLPNGICDPVYICNIFAQELGLGDGRTNFEEVV